MSDLLKVLDMSEERQIEWLNKNLIDYGYNGLGNFSLADLAFRLRDEAQSLNRYQWVCAEVYNKVRGYKLQLGETYAPTALMWIWFATRAKPIHWIIVALIAQESKK